MFHCAELMAIHGIYFLGVFAEFDGMIVDYMFGCHQTSRIRSDKWALKKKQKSSN